MFIQKARYKKLLKNKSQLFLQKLMKKYVIMRMIIQARLFNK